MQYLILANHHGIPIEQVSAHGNNWFTLLVTPCSPLDGCIVYDDENGNNRVGHTVQVLRATVDLAGKMHIDLVLSPETVMIDFHPAFDGEIQT